jgi:tetratricopeptide (TPR) repeat protein
MFDSIYTNIKLQYFILSVVAILAYSNTINHSYTWDDALVIQQNKFTKAGINGLKDIWTKRVFLSQRNAYRPIPQTIYALTYQFAPDNPKAAHVVNISFYVLASISTFWFLTLLFHNKQKWLLFFISLLFVLHPVHTEVVANIKSLDEISAYLFALLSLIFWIKTINKFNLFSLFMVLLFFGVAILSKISAITIFPIYFVVLFYLIDVKRNYLAELKIIFSSEFYATKLIFILYTLLSFLLLFAFISNIQIIFSLLILASFLLIYKSESEKIILLQVFLLTFLLTFLGLKSSLIFFLTIVNIGFIKKFKKINFQVITIILLTLFTEFYLSRHIGKLFLPLIISIVPILYFYFKKVKTIIFLVTTAMIAIITTAEINNIILGLFFIILFLLIYKKDNNTIRKHLQSLMLLLLFFFDIYYLKSNQEISYIQGNIKKEFYNIQPKENTTEVFGVSVLHNSLAGENDIYVKYSTIAKIQLKYLQLLVFPHPLVHQYGTNQLTKTTLKDWKVWFSIVLHLALFLFALYKLKSKNPLAFGILFYLFTISIYTNIIVLMPDTLAERFLFLPSLGFSIFIVFLFEKLFNQSKIKNTKLAFLILMIPIFILFLLKVIDRNKAWKNNLELAIHTLPHAQNNAAINAQYATELLNLNRDHEKVIKHYKKAIEIYPEFQSAIKDLSMAYIQKEKSLEAKKYLLKNLAFNSKDWESYYYLGFISYNSKEYNTAIVYFEKALKYSTGKILKENNINTSEYLARCYFNTEQFEKATNLLNYNYSILNSKSSIILLGNMYYQNNNFSKSIETYSILLEEYPDDIDLLNTIEILKNSL